ncbi:hypothetical protein QLL95_gp0046 [Cotonvirus japonicus]|uniref:Uncharacterized protein n=1 Tax=Cotonvirus japonicus TaxID=2811091 RepID=A0ABM7NQV6_9VIRU|nr:hypothetical protein QLL95_gp0046 [Cotonvirus japonicus]BCS82535.1 hypothetical protein [Cotonvirus japonicus]
MVKINYISLERDNYNSILINLFQSLLDNNYVNQSIVKINVIMKNNLYNNKSFKFDKNLIENTQKIFNHQLSNYFYYNFKIKDINELVKFLHLDSEFHAQKNTCLGTWKNISVKFNEFKIIFRNNSVNVKTKNYPSQNTQEIEDFVRNIFVRYIDCKYITK